MRVLRISLTGIIFVAMAVSGAAAQEHQHPPATQTTTPEQHQHEHGGAASLFSARDGSGTSWLPTNSDMYAVHSGAGRWEFMWHGNAFLQFLHESANEHRGSTQTGSINWFMGMARREIGAARIGFRTMLSLEPATVGGCGYPDLLATGEQCDGESIHDRQHPHDFFMELAGEYERSIRGSVRWQIYGGLAGEPALGPVAYPHRLSAMPNPLAPIGHHWLDASHITFGVVTTGVFTPRWKAEASVFNGREPDEDRWDLDLAALDSFSGRVSFAPTADIALQVSAGHLNEAEAGEGSLPRVDVDRVTASVTYHRRMAAESLWASTLAWGRNEEAGVASHALLVETSLTREQNVWFGRFEVGGKPAHDLDLHDRTDVMTVSKIQAGYTRYVTQRGGLLLGVGGHLAAGLVPEALEPHYGHRANLGVGMFLTVRPAAHAR